MRKELPFMDKIPGILVTLQAFPDLVNRMHPALWSMGGQLHH